MNSGRVFAHFHRLVWRRLPHRARRAALAGISGLLAPRPSASSVRAPPYIVVGPLRASTGLGVAARLMHDGLLALGHPVFGVDVTSLLRQNADVTDFTFEDGRHRVGAGSLLVHANPPLLPLVLAAIPRALVRGKHVVGCWAWELEHVPRAWARGAAFVHEIWAPSRFAADAISRLMARPCRIVPHPVAIRAREAARPPVRPFTVLAIADATSSLARKNPAGAVAAFRAAFDDDPNVLLLMKVSRLGLAGDAARAFRQSLSGLRNVSLLEDVVPADGLSSLYNRSHVLLSMHRSEGFGLTLAEAMLHGLPVVSTCWSGEADFLDPTNGVQISSGLVSAADPQGTYNLPHLRWADPSIQEAADALRTLRADGALRMRLGQAGRQAGADRWSAARVYGFLSADAPSNLQTK